MKHLPYSIVVRMGFLLRHYGGINQAILSVAVLCRESIGGDWCWSCISIRA